MTLTMGDETDLRIRLDPDLKARLMTVFERKGVFQKMGVVRILIWFVHQDDVFQSMILEQFNKDHHADVAKLVLARLIDEEQSRLDGSGKFPGIHDDEGDEEIKQSAKGKAAAESQIQPETKVAGGRKPKRNR